MVLRTLGGLELQDSSFHRPKTLLLLAYLALEGPKERHHVAELLWPHAPGKGRLHRLRVMLSQLRQEVSGIIEADKGQIWVTLDADAKTFLSVFEAGRYEEALKHYSGPFLQAFQQSDWSVELEEWVYGTREFLALRAREALLRLGEGEAARGRFDKAAKHAEEAYVLAGAADPDPEDLGRCYVLLMAEGHSRALEVRKEAREFGITLQLSPEEARAQLCRVADAATPRAHNLPLRSTSFISRDAELIEIATLLADPNCQLLTLCGPGGVGKTRLAVHAALEQYNLGKFRDGVYFVALEALTSAQGVPNAIAVAIGLELQGYLDPLSQLQDHLAKKDILLILDNYEHLLEAALLPTQLLQASPKLKLLVTTRERLNVEEEWVLDVEGLSLPPHDATEREDITPFAAVQLFSRRAKRARRDFSLSQENILDIARICRLTQGFPLALELAATWVKHLSCGVIAEELEKSLDFLTASTRNLPDRHKSMRAVFEHSWRLLNPNEQQFLRRLSVFSGGFRREAAAEVAGATISSLASLVDKSLLRLSPEGRYDRHPLLYQYTEEKLAEHPEEQHEAQEAHMSYYLHPRFRSLAPGLSNTLNELENMRVAWLWAAAKHRHAELLLITKQMQRLHAINDRFREGVEMFNEGLGHLGEANSDHHSTIGAILTSLSWLHLSMGDLDEALEAAGRCANLLKGSNVEHDIYSLWQAAALMNVVAFYRGRWDTALYHAEAMFQYARRLAAVNKRWTWAVSGAQDNLALVNIEMGNYDLAQRFLQEALPLARQQDQNVDDRLESSGILMFHTNRPQEAKELFEEALSLRQDSKGVVEKGLLLSYLALANCELEHYTHARSCAQSALRLLQNTKTSVYRAGVYVNLGRVFTSLKVFSEAHDCLTEGMTISYRSHFLSYALYALVAFAEWYCKQGDFETPISLSAFIAEHSNARHSDKKLAQELLANCRQVLPPKDFEAAFKRGKALKLEEAVNLVLQTAA